MIKLWLHFKNKRKQKRISANCHYKLKIYLKTQEMLKQKTNQNGGRYCIYFFSKHFKLYLGWSYCCSYCGSLFGIICQHTWSYLKGQLEKVDTSTNQSDLAKSSEEVHWQFENLDKSIDEDDNVTLLSQIVTKVFSKNATGNNTLVIKVCMCSKYVGSTTSKNRNG